MKNLQNIDFDEKYHLDSPQVDFVILSEGVFQRVLTPCENFRKIFQRNRVMHVFWLFFDENHESVEINSISQLYVDQIWYFWSKLALLVKKG